MKLEHFCNCVSIKYLNDWICALLKVTDKTTIKMEITHKRRKCPQSLLSIGLVAILLLYPFENLNCWAVTYYVDALNGQDTNSGTRDGVPWKTLGKVNAATFHPGDVIKFKRGSVWKENITLQINYSGKPSEWIEFSDYGEGARPKFDFSNNEAEGITIYNSSFLRIQNLHIVNAKKAGIKVNGDLLESELQGGGGSSGGCYIAAQTDVVEDHEGFNYAEGFEVVGCIIEGNGKRNDRSDMGFDAFHVSELKISDTLFDSNQQSGVRIQSCRNVTIERCEARNHGGGNDHDGFIIQNTDTLEMYDCIAHHNSESGIDLGGYESFEGDMRDARIYRCFVYENGDDGIAVSGCDIDDPTPFYTHNIHFSYCLSFRNGTHNLKVYQNAYNVFFYNCLFDGSESHNMKLDAGAHDIYFENCIVSNSGGFPLDIWTDEDYPSPYNLNFNFMIWYPTLPESEYLGANYWFANPEFSNPSENDYRLKPGSPAIDSGTPIGEQFNRGLNPDSEMQDIDTLDQNANGLGWEIGPYVYPE